nr:thiamine diphosphokinase [Neobacillus sp. Marseille-Q6967]
MKINIVAGGPAELLPDLKEYSGEDLIWVGVDRGVFILLEKNIRPFMAFGDFDSVTAAELQVIERQVEQMNRFKPEKDETDMELALNWAIQQDAEEIRIFGATGGRIDHTFANIQLLFKPLLEGNKVDISLIDQQNSLFLRGPGSYQIEKSPEKKYISFIPQTLSVEDLTLNGFKYPLNNRHINIGSTLCISNELISDYGTFSFSKGILLVVRSDDKKTF